jgi:pimeloyl-ACP methyl ester carboxylesterase
VPDPEAIFVEDTKIPSTYVVAVHDRTIRPEWQRRMARERLGVEPVELASGHCPNVSQPDRLAALLVEVAAARDVDTRPPAGQPPRRKGTF